LKAVGEEVLGNAQITLEFTEPAHPTKCVSEDQQAPAIADDGKRGSNGTERFIVVLEVACHLIGHVGCKPKPSWLHYATESRATESRATESGER